MTYRIGVLGLGNLGQAAAAAVRAAPDCELVGLFTRRDPKTVTLTGDLANAGVAVRSQDELPGMRDAMDVLILGGGSATDLPEQTPRLAHDFNVVDSFDTHARIPEHFEKVDTAARAGGKLAVISTGWDPGLFSLERALLQAVLPDGVTRTFWGRGVSQGHSDALRRVPGVADARQYTVPRPEAVAAARAGSRETMSARQMHLRECYVVLKPGADAAAVEQQIKQMPNYFADYDTTVHFIDQATLDREHAGLPHGGFVLRSGNTPAGQHLVEFRLELCSNPQFTAQVMLAYARAAARLHAEGVNGAQTVFDIAPRYLLPLSDSQQRATLL